MLLAGVVNAFVCFAGHQKSVRSKVPDIPTSVSVTSCLHCLIMAC